MSLIRIIRMIAIGSTCPPIKAVARVCAVAIALLLPFAAAAEPIQLKLAFFGSDQTDTYLYGVKPFVDAVNAEGKGLLAIKVYPNGALGKAVAEQPGLVQDGVADIAWVVPGQTPYRFPDNELLEMPGLFRDAREGTLAYTRLIAAKALRGYQDFFVIGAYTSAPSIIHSRKPIESLAALKGQKIRTNNPVEAEALERLGAIPTVMPASSLADAIGKGAVDGAIMSPGGFFQFGGARVAMNHYHLDIGAAPLVVVMSRKKFDGLPDAAKAIIRKYSGARAAAIWIESFGATERQSLDKIKSDPERKVFEPSPSDLETAQRTYRSMIEAWAAKTPHNRELMKMIEAELATIRSAK
jgi:TRAP-type C4-dicarboxylate transport system substrate-binding protein